MEQTINIQELVQDQHNFNKGTAEGEKLMQKSLTELGAGRSILIDKDGNIIAGNKTQKAAIAAGIQKVRVIESDGSELIAVKRTDLSIDSKKGRELALADNVTTQVNLAWDAVELESVAAQEGIDLPDWGLDPKDLGIGEDDEAAIERKRKEFEERMAAGEISEEDEEYQEFVKKFEIKKTTDDCYTPELVYEAVANWVANEYGVNRKNFVRPFYPGGDYQKEKYAKDAVVVDNPPFSILAEITRFYKEQGVAFFLFAPRISNLSVASSQGFTNLCVGAGITYDNGAIVPTSFITNLETEYIAKSCPSLYKAVTEANEKVQAELHREIPKYAYPDEVVTAAMLSKYSKYGVEFGARFKDSQFVTQLDAQKESGKAIYAGGLLVSEAVAAEKAAAEKAAAEKAAATRWELSDRERAIVKSLSK